MRGRVAEGLAYSEIIRELLSVIRGLDVLMSHMESNDGF